MIAKSKNQRFLTIGQVAEELAENPRTTLRRILDGELSAFNLSSVGKRPVWRISRDALEKFLRERASAGRELVETRCEGRAKE